MIGFEIGSPVEEDLVTDILHVTLILSIHVYVP